MTAPSTRRRQRAAAFAMLDQAYIETPGLTSIADDLEVRFRRYLAHLEDEGASDTTIATYRQTLKVALEWYERDGGPRPFSIEMYVGTERVQFTRAHRRKNPRSIAQLVRVLKTALLHGAAEAPEWGEVEAAQARQRRLWEKAVGL